MIAVSTLVTLAQKPSHQFIALQHERPGSFLIISLIIADHIVSALSTF